MPNAVVMLRENPHYRRDAFMQGLAANGYRVVGGVKAPQREDVLVVWNRYGDTHTEATRWTKAGARVIVAENGYMGRDWRGSIWYAMALDWHMGVGTWNVGDVARALDLFGELAPWRVGTGDVVLLAQRGIGALSMIAPNGWLVRVMRDLSEQGIPFKTRAHPGVNPDQEGLDAALANARAAVTWSSGAAIKALLAGVPVYYGLTKWIGSDAAMQYARPLPNPFLGDRSTMLHKLSWAMWELGEISSGRAFDHLLCRPEEALQRRAL
jgi:hypothetical protein